MLYDKRITQMIQIDPQTTKKYQMVLINNHIPESDAHFYLRDRSKITSPNLFTKILKTLDIL